MVRHNEKLEALKLRREGWSYNLIQKKVGVAKSTLSEWLRDVPYKPNRIVTQRIKLATEQLTTARRKDKLTSLMNAHSEAIGELYHLTKRDLWMVGLGLYIGEGRKTTGQVGFSNSDPKAIMIIMAWFRDVIGLETDNFALRLHLYPDNNEIESKKYWSKITKIPSSQFQKTHIDVRNNKGAKKRNMLPYGTIHVVIRANGNPRNGVFLFRKIMFWSEEALNKLRV